MKPYYKDDLCTLYHCDFRKVLKLASAADCIIADPPYGETGLSWDRWLRNWPRLVAQRVTGVCTLWCWGSFRMFWEHRREFNHWQFVQDLQWEKQNGTGLHNDRFRRVHETCAQFRLLGSKWEQIYHVAPVTLDARRRSVRRDEKPAHWNSLNSSGVYDVEEGGPRLVRSVLFEKNSHRHALHPTQKPDGVTRRIIQYSCPPGGLIFVPFVGSGTELKVAKELGIRAIGAEVDRATCDAAVSRLRQEVLSV